MRRADEVVREIVVAFRERGFAQAPGLKRFGFAGETPSAVTVLREKATTVRVPLDAIRRAVEFVREDPRAYTGGPGRLRKCGVTHVNSPVYALLRLLPADRIVG